MLNPTNGLSNESIGANSVRDFLAARPVILNLWATAAAFGTYFCMYGFRKPFTAGAFDGELFGQTNQKAILVSAQVIGYLISKLIGIRVIAEMPSSRRGLTILLLIGASHLAQLLFAIVPSPWHVVCLFLNGLPLGLVFGLVLGFLEGRRLTEALAAGLCASFILAGGVCKSVGSGLLELGVSERWMPFMAGLVFYLPLGLGVWMLTCIPPPDHQDVALRSVREPMDRLTRSRFLRRYAVGLGSVAGIYFLFSIVRSLRDDFAPEIWKSLGVTAIPSTYSWTDLYVAIGVLALNATSVVIRDNRKALMASFGVSALGTVLIVGALLGWHWNAISPFAFMVCIGLGLYLPYVAVHTTIFERMIALTRDRGNIGFLMYVADSLGYAGAVIVMLSRQVWTGDPLSLRFFSGVCWIAALVAMGLIGIAAWYFSTLKVDGSIERGAN